MFIWKLEHMTLLFLKTHHCVPMHQYMLDKQSQHFEDIENKNKTDNFEVSHVTLTLRVATRTV